MTPNDTDAYSAKSSFVDLSLDALLISEKGEKQEQGKVIYNDQGRIQLISPKGLLKHLLGIIGMS